MKNLLVGFVAGVALTVLGFTLKGQGSAPPASAQFGGAVDGKEERCTSEQLAHNRQLVQKFFTPEVSPQERYDMLTANYIQHNEAIKRFAKINGLNDRDALKAIDDLLTKNGQRPDLVAEPGRPKNEMASRIITTCDYVVALHRTYLPDPQKAGAYYPAYDYELWRMEDGKFAEHWDSQKIRTPLPDFILAPMRDLQSSASDRDAPAKGK